MKLDRRDLLKLGAAAGAAIAGLGALDFVARQDRKGVRTGKVTGKVQRIPSMCQMCTTACGVIAHVKDGRLLGIVGNPEDPNSRGAICAKGAAGPSIQYDPYRLQYPMKRVGARGEGRWRRITWDEAYEEIATRLRELREAGRPHEFAFQQGRNRSADAVTRFLDAYGTPSHFNHRALCSSNKRAGIQSVIYESDWDLGDYENAKFVLNFGSNWAEAHQGHIPVAIRMMKGREAGAKLVTFESRLSNTAALSDEWHCVKPGTDGLIALAMSHVICSEGLWNKPFFDRWANLPADSYAAHVAQYPPELAEEHSGVPADVIRRLAREFAAAAPRATTICNRGSSAHVNGAQNDRAITILNLLVGSMGQVGGFNWHPHASYDKKEHPLPGPIPPRPPAKSSIKEPAEYPLASRFSKMGVAPMTYRWVKEGREKLSALMTYNVDLAWAFPESPLVQEVLRDETLLPFHVCLDVMYSDTAHLADLVLPWTTWMERWDVDARPPQSLVDYIGLRQPVVKPLGEAKDLREIFPELARRIGGGMEAYYPWPTVEAYVEAQLQNVPGGLGWMREHGVWVNPKKKPYRGAFERALTEEELQGTSVDPETQIITRRGTDGRPEAVGLLVDGVARVGLRSPSRRFEVYSHDFVKMGEAVGRQAAYAPLPIYEPVAGHDALEDDQLIMITFKWNVHNAHRTMQSKWLMEIVHSNPAWLNPTTAERLGLSHGDWIELEGLRPKNALVPGGDGSAVGTVRTRVHLTEGVHPQVIAFSHNAGRKHGGWVATNGRHRAADLPGMGGPADGEVDKRLWWEGTLSVPQNGIMPIHPDPRSGQQAFHDTIVRIRKVADGGRAHG